MPLRLTFRLKLLLIVGAALLALLGILASDAVIQSHQARQLSDVEQRLVPKLELGPHLKGEFESLGRSMRDAVAAEDPSALGETAQHRARIFELIASAPTVLEPSVAASLRFAIADYYQAALDISHRMIAGEAGERLVEDVARMQELQVVARDLITQATMLEKDELARALSSVRQENEDTNRWRFGIAFTGLVLVCSLSFWVGKSLLQTLRHLSDGFARFGTGDFSQEIPVTTRDELGDVSLKANQMAQSLRRLDERRERQTWLDSGRAELSSELRGALEPAEVGTRALAYLAKRIDAFAGALYTSDGSASLRLCAGFATSQEADINPAQSFALGEGLLGQAFRGEGLLVIDDPPAGYLEFRSGLLEGRPRALLMAPLAHFGQRVGVMEFALLAPSSERVREFLLQAGPAVAAGLVVANHAASLRKLLAESQAQAERLSTQEAELRQTNQELTLQQEELRRANEELHEQRSVLHRQNLELEKTQRALEEQAEELAQVSAYKSQFLANMSHELRTPLNSMLLLSRLLSENEPRTLTSKQVEYADIIHAAGNDLLGLINQVLDLSKIEAGKQSVELRTVELTHFVAFVHRNYEVMASAKGLTLSSRIDADMPRVWVTDVQRVERILSNLVGNAIKFTAQGEVRLRIGRPPAHLAPIRTGTGAVALVVSDTGMGIDADDPERVFTPFEQMSNDTAAGGTGLGLSIARESARLLGGDLFYESKPGVGTSFSCVLPEVANDMATGKPLSVHRRSVPSKVDDDRHELAPDEAYLLIVEDDLVLAEQLAHIGRSRRLKVVIATNGREGLLMARKQPPSGIVLDVKLPDMEGWTVMDRLKRDPTTKDVPVHFVSGVDAAQRGLALGAVGYLVKPATHDELVDVVQALAPMKSPQSTRVLVAEADDEEGAAIVAMLSAESVEADHVKSAQAALQRLEQQNYGCIVLDLSLPGLDGLGLLETVRHNKAMCSPRVVIHTRRALTKEEARQLELYSEAVILKDGSSAQRLIEEVRLFVRHVTEQSVDARTSPPASSAAADALNGLTVLLAEDDMRTVYAISALLQAKGAKVTVAATGKEALALLEQHDDIDVVLMDIMMPEMDGYEAMSKLRSMQRYAELPVVALTAKAMKGERDRCLQAGATDYLTKPVDGDTLIRTICARVQQIKPHVA